MKIVMEDKKRRKTKYIKNIETAHNNMMQRYSPPEKKHSSRHLITTFL